MISKKKIVANKKNFKIIKFSQDGLLKDDSEFYNEINNKSLFEEDKIFFIENANDKILKIIQEVSSKIEIIRFMFSQKFWKKNQS